MRSILLNAYDDGDFDKRLDVALDLARSFDSHLSIVSAMPFEAAGAVDPYGAAFAALIPVWREEAESFQEQVEKDLANEDVPWDWESRPGPPASALLRRSALADLIVLGSREPRTGGKAPSFTAGELAVSASCPVLVLPDECERMDPDRPALVAWDGSAEASHALRAAVPLLQHAKSVFLATVRSDKPSKNEYDLPPVSGADYLARHGISSEMFEIEADEKGVAHSLLNAASARNVGLIVMGAYGRTRLTEWIFGGVTRAMLSEVRVPLLLKH